MKVAKIIVTSFVPRAYREWTTISGSPLGYFSHSQNFGTVESIIDLIKFNIQKELLSNPGLDVDLIIVNNDVGCQSGIDFLNSIDGVKCNNGVIKIIHRENFGRSFGGYDHAFSLLKNNYDYFIFTEDDVLIWHDGYARAALEQFNSVKDCGFVAYIGISNRFSNRSIDDAIHAHGGVGFSSVHALNKIVEVNGCLPHVKCGESQDYLNIIEKGEVGFTNIYGKLGLALSEIPPKFKYYDFAYDLMKNRNVSRYLNKVESCGYGFRQHAARMYFSLKNFFTTN